MKMLQNQKMKRKEAKQNKPFSNKQISSATKLPAINNKKSTSTINQNLSINIASYQDEGLITLIQQYMIKNNLFDSLEVFQKDCLKGFKQSVKSIQILKKQLIQAFDSGNRQTFFQKFTQFVPLSMRTKDVKTLKMQFYINLYFFIYCIHPSLGKKKTIDTVSKQHFTSYLQGRGSTLAKQPQFLSFYALAYLPKPQQHQTFKSMFTKQWIQDIRRQFVLFVDRLYPAGKIPTIVAMYDRFIEYSLEGEKFSSVALTEPDEEGYYQPAIQEQIEQNIDDSIMNNPQPVLLQNNPNSFNRVMNNNSTQKFPFLGQNQQHNASFNSKNYNTSLRQQKTNSAVRSPHLATQKQRQEMIEIHELNQRIIELEQQRDRLLSFIQNSKQKYQNLENDFRQFSESIKNILQQSQNKWFKIIQELYNVAMDLLNAANNLQQGIPLNDMQLLMKRGQKLERYKGFVNMNIQDLLADNVADYSLFQRPEHDISVDFVKKNNDYIEKQNKLLQIDFQKIKNILSTQTNRAMSQQQTNQILQQKRLILQALRWRMSKIRGAFQKRQVVLSFTLNDVLEITEMKQGKIPLQNSIIHILLNPANPLILQQTVLFISALSKDYYGRQYLFEQKLMIKMMELRKSPAVELNVREIILVTFQFQSIKKSCQVVMVQNGLIQQVVEKLDKQRDSMNAFQMEYATALVLNLILSKKGLDRAERITSQILMALINLMETQNSNVKSYVNAALYPLFARKVFRQKALQFGMEQNIKYLVQNSPTVQFKHQLNYVYSRLMMENDEQEEQKDEDNQFDDIDDEEIEQYFDQIKQQRGRAMTGEFLLMKKYPLTGPDAMKQMSYIKQEVRATFSKAIYYDRELTERASIQTPLLGKGRKSQIHQQEKGLTHNNSVYSNKSSNRVLRSQKNSRIKNPAPISKTAQKERLDTVHQNGSEASLKDYAHMTKGQRRVRQQERGEGGRNNNRMVQLLQMQNSEGTFRQNQGNKQESPLKGSFVDDFQNKPIITINQNNQLIASNQQNALIAERLQQQNAQEAIIRNKKLKPYEQSQEYVGAFRTRAMLVRTPPQK